METWLALKLDINITEQNGHNKIYTYYRYGEEIHPLIPKY